MAKQQLTGPDYIVILADAAERQSAPYATQFRMAVEQAIIGPAPLAAGPTLSEMAATAELAPHDHTAVTVIGAAARAAAEQRDVQSLVEIAHWGAAMIARWPLVLMTTVEGHPRYTLKGTGWLAPHAPAGWYDDPGGRWEKRYWDGEDWTDHVTAGGSTRIDPLPPPLT